MVIYCLMWTAKTLHVVLLCTAGSSCPYQLSSVVVSITQCAVQAL